MTGGTGAGWAMRRLLTGLACGASLALLGAAGPHPDWRPLAPKAVERVKRLAREGVYNGLLFHRVIEGFVDQTGNPNNHDGGTSAYPDLPAEFSARVAADAVTTVVARSDAVEGFLGSVPVAGVSAK